MNKFTALLFCSLPLHNVFAQDLPAIKELVAGNRLTEARDAVNQFLADPGNEKNSDAWYFNGYILNTISKNNQLSPNPAADKKQAFAAFTKCYSLNAQNKWLSTEEYASLYDLYNGFFDMAAAGYRDGDYSGAFDHFAMADTVQQFLYHYQLAYKGFKFSKVDTSLLLNAAVCAFRAKREKDGAAYYARLADARIKDPAYLPVYHALVDHFIAVKDELAFRKYLRIGREMFPYDQYWVQAEMDMVKSKGVNDALIKSYEEKLAKDPANYTLHYNFSADLFNMLYTAENKPERPGPLKEKLEQQLQRTAALQQSGVMTELLMARFYYNEAFALGEALKTAGSKAEAQKTALQTSVKNNLDKAFDFADKVYHFFEGNDRMKRMEVESFRMATEILANVSEANGQADKALGYRNKLQAIAKIKPVR